MQYQENTLEYTDCCTFAEWLELQKNLGKIRKFTHISNETYTKSRLTHLKNMRQGVHKGVPDYLIVTKRHILFIEMKRLKGGTVSQDQQEWIDAILLSGGIATVCCGVDEAIFFVTEYLKEESVNARD